MFTFTAPNPVLDSLSDVNVTGATNGQILKYNSSNSTWIAGSVPSTTTSLSLLSDVVITSPTPNEALIYDPTIGKWINGPVNSADVTLGIGQLTDVNLDNLTCCDQLKYDCDQEAWVNYKPGGYTEFDVKIVDNGSGRYEILELDGTKLKSSTGELYSGLEFKVGGVYRFKLDHISNASGPLRFSTTPDTIVNPDYPDGIGSAPTITPYTTGVSIVGEAGQPGSYVQICIDESAPKFLYLYSDEAVQGSQYALDTSCFGGELPFPVTDSINTLETNTAKLNSGASNLSVTTEYFSTTPSKTATLAAGVEGLIKTYCHNLQPPLTSVTITGTAGQFSCASTVLESGQKIVLSGTFSGTGSITGYSDPTTYRINTTNNSNTFTLVKDSDSSPLVTTAGTTGLTYTPVIGTMVITVTNAGWKSSGTGTITFDAAGDSCTMQYVNSKWFCIGNNGAAFA